MLIILLCAIVTSACTSSKTIGQVKPIVDMKGVNQEDYKIDLSQCQAYADEVEVGKTKFGVYMSPTKSFVLPKD